MDATAFQRVFNTGLQPWSYQLIRKGATMITAFVCMAVAVLSGWATCELQCYAEQYVAARHAND